MVQTVAVFFGVIVVWLAAALYLAARLGLSLHQAILYVPLKLAYRIDDRPAATVRKAESPVIYVVLHQSRLDPMLMLSLLPPETLHILDQESARSIWLEPWRELARTIEFNAHHVFVSRRLVRHLRGKGRLAVYMPDDVEPDAKAFRLYRAVARIATQADAKIVPIFVGGSRHSWLSLSPPAVAPRRLLPKLSITALTAATLGELRERPGHPAATASNALFDYCATARFAAANLSRSLFAAVRDAADLYGNDRIAIGDEAVTLTYRRLLADARRAGRRLAAITAEGEPVGLLLPGGPALAVSLLALNAAGRVAALPDVSGGAAAMATAFETAGIKTVLSMHRYIEEANLAELAATLEARGMRLIWLEEIERSASLLDRLTARKLWHQPVLQKGANRPAVMLFAAESGAQSAIVLSDRNLLANAMQMAARLSVSPRDRVVEALPVSDALGLTAGLVLPLLSGAETRFVDLSAEPIRGPKFRTADGPSVIVGSDAFLAAYADGAEAEEIAGVRTVLSDDATLRAETARFWSERPGTTVLHAFVRPEAAGAIALNSLTHNRPGSAGRLLPGMEIRLEAVEGLADGGRLWISGPNVMLGRIGGEAPGILQPPLGGWHDTGDAVSTDREGFFTRHGRADSVTATGVQSPETARSQGRRAKAA
jgi:acyl-[acyl-carrier-protein]-phospholipid O-acyltransferase/long-chain-fatty-acid--[acyl-carrier-protein] ligase